MSTNPMFNNRTSPNGATAPNSPLNDSHKKYFQGHNTFPYSRKVFNTLRYAELTPFEVIRGVPGDILPFGSKHFLRSYTLKSPLMSDIFMRKTFFMVDMRAILPKNWDKWYKQPAIGDDVLDDVGTYCSGFINAVDTLRDWITQVDVSTINMSNYLYMATCYLKTLFLFESWFSDGSLMASMGLHMSSMLRYSTDYYKGIASYDDFFDKFVDDFLKTSTLCYRINGINYFSVDSNNSLVGDNRLPIRQIIDLLRNNPDFEVVDPLGSNLEFVQSISEHFSNWFGSFRISGSSSQSAGFNFDVLYAYQICASSFYTNTSVDYIYNAELYRENQNSLAQAALELYRISGSDLSFDYNGLSCDYDVCSGYILKLMISSCGVTPELSNLPDVFNNAYGFLSNIFFYRRSLRYGDYFTGAKTRPLSVGDVSIQVNDSRVSAVDVTRNIMRQRFFNAVGRVRNNISDYLREVMNGTASPRDDEPRYLASVVSKVSGFEVENTTSDDQGKIVTNLKSGDSNYIYEVSVGSPCIILGIASFEVPRVYCRTIDRFFFHQDRYDMFNPFMQYIGDQEIKAGEKDGRYTLNTEPFAYTLRHMEYKQRFPIASGGFVRNLKGWLMITDNDDDENGNATTSDGTNHITPEYIRSKNYELDRFYTSLTGYSLGSYFHFICEFDNQLNAKRQMEYSPSIL